MANNRQIRLPRTQWRERLRMAILAGLLGALLAFYGLGYALFRKDYLLRFLTPPLSR